MGRARFFDPAEPDAETPADQCRGDNPQRKEPLEETGAFAAIRGFEAFGEIKRDDHSDETGADALQQTTEYQRAETVGQGNHRDAQHEEQSAGDHHRLAPEPVGEHAGEERGDDAAEQHRRDDEGKLARVKAGGRFQIRKRACDDPDIDAIKQATEACDEEKESDVSGGIAGGHGNK